MRKKIKPHNILEIINLPSSARNFIGGQFNYLHQNGYKMYLICSDDGIISEYCNSNHVEYEPIELARMLSPIADLRALFKIYKHIKKNNIDTIIAHQAKARLLGTTAAFLAHVPNRIIFAHGVLFETMSGIKRKLIIAMDKLVAAMAHKTVCVSPSVAKVRLQYKIEKPEQQYFLGEGTCGGIDTKFTFNPDLLDKDEQKKLKSVLGIRENDFVVGFCGRLVRDKGIYELVDGFRKFKDTIGSYDKIKLFIIGRKEIRDAISESLFKKIERSPDIIHVEYIDNREIYKYFALFDVMVLPSYREGFGMVTLECAAMGVPAIVSRSTGCIDSIKENYTGIFCDIDPISIANQIGYMYHNSELRIMMGKNARNHVINNYDSTVIWPHVIKVIED